MIQDSLNSTSILIPCDETESGLAQRLNVAEDIIIVDDLFFKLSIEAVWDMIVAPGSVFRERFIGKDTFDRAIKTFAESFDLTEDEIFRSHLLVDSDLREAVEQTIAAEEPEAYKYMTAFNDRDVLIIESEKNHDSRWQDIRDEILKYYVPKSIRHKIV